LTRCVQVEWQRQAEQVREEREQLLQTRRGQARGYLQLGAETLNMLRLLSSRVVEPFLAPELADRLAASLNLSLRTLAGPTCQNLKVDCGAGQAAIGLC
jgi:ubiquitin conjugation factor E4 B